MTELMKRYESETGECATWTWHEREFLTDDYIAWLESKAEAYNRLMNGIGQMSIQEWANFLGAPVTLDRDGKVKAHYSSPVRYSEEEGWWYNPHNRRFEIPRHLVDTHGCWPRLSIKFPDGWEN